MPRYLTPKPKVMGTPSLGSGLVFTKSFQKMSFKLMTSALRRHGHIFEKCRFFGNDVTGGSNFVRRFVF